MGSIKQSSLNSCAKLNGKCTLFIAFDDPGAEELADRRIDMVLQEIFEFVRDDVIPAFEPFFD